MSVADDLLKIKSQIPEKVTLVAVSKTKPYDTILEAYRAGHRVFGENKVMELADKYEHLPKDIQWHFIGHLQTNKVKYLVPFVHLIHSIDSLKLLRVVDREALKVDRVINCLFQVRIAREETKFGLSEQEAEAILESSEFKEFRNIKITGVMGMASFTDDMQLVRTEFKNLSTIFNRLRLKYFVESHEFKEMSMGMSEDYLIAIEEGATLIRIGSSIFGERNYTTN